jgi:hypothetical protein
LFVQLSVPERLNCFKCDCGALTAEGREACGGGMSHVAKQGDSPTATGQAAQGRLATAPRAKAWVVLAPNTKRRPTLARQRKQPWCAMVLPLVFKTGAWRHERQQGQVRPLSDECYHFQSDGVRQWAGYCSGPANTFENARIGILYSAYFARPNAKVNRRQCEALTSALNRQLDFYD